MIQITNPNIKPLAEKHYLFIKNDVSKRLDFYIDLSNCLGNNISVPNTQTICEKYDFHSTQTPCTLIDPFLKKSYRKKGKSYRININQVESLLFSLNKHIVKDSNKLNFFKELHDFFVLIKKELKEVLSGDPILIEKFTGSAYLSQTIPIYKKCLELVFRYEEFISGGFEVNNEVWDSYKMTSAVDMSVCPYCNRNWINTVNTKDQKKVVNPQLDHFFCKNKFPLLRLSFYNLIPSCDTCNTRLKKSDQFNLTEYLHPYIEGYGQAAKFKALALSSEAAIGLAPDYKVWLEFDSILPNNSNKIINNHTTFKIDDIYAKHGDIISEIFRKKYLFSIKYLEVLKSTITTHNISYEEMYRVAFGNYFEEADFKKRPFAKLTKDIASQLGMIY